MIHFNGFVALGPTQLGPNTCIACEPCWTVVGANRIERKVICFSGGAGGGGVELRSVGSVKGKNGFPGTSNDSFKECTMAVTLVAYGATRGQQPRSR